MIPYTYEVIESTPQGLVLRYASQGRGPINVGTRLPYAGESLDAVAAQYSPVQYWLDQDAAKEQPPVGAAGSFTPPEPQPPTPEQIIKAFTDAIQARLDDFARTRNYDGILSAATYATSAVPKFAAEGQYAVQARDATWAAAYQILAEVQSGTRPMPSSPEDIFPELPALQWPV